MYVHVHTFIDIYCQYLGYEFVNIHKKLWLYDVIYLCTWVLAIYIYFVWS